MSGITPGRSRRSLEQWGGLGAVIYVVLFVGGSILAYAGQPDTGDPPAKLISYYSDSGHRDKIGFGWLITIVGVFFFLWFLGALRQFLRRIDDQGMLPAVATIGGAVYASLTLAGRSVDAAVKTMSDDTFRHQVFPGLIHAADDTGYLLHAAGGVGLGALMISAALATRRARRIPAWTAWVSIVFGILAVFSIFFIPLFLNAIWLLAAGLLLFIAQPEPSRAPQPT
jgi:hypothetical protein